MLKYIWIPLLIVVSIILSLFSVKHSTDLINTNYRTFYIFVIGVFNSAVWILMTKITKNIIFDSLLYSVTISVTCTIMFFVLGCGLKFSNIQWVGTVLVIIGFVLMRLK